MSSAMKSVSGQHPRNITRQGIGDGGAAATEGVGDLDEQLSGRACVVEGAVCAVQVDAVVSASSIEFATDGAQRVQTIAPVNVDAGPVELIAEQATVKAEVVRGDHRPVEEGSQVQCDVLKHRSALKG